MLKNDQEITRTSQTYRRQNQSAWPECCAFLSCRAQLPSHAKKIYAVTIVGTILKPLQIGEIMSINNEILQFSYFYWKSNEKKADEKTTLFQDGICHYYDIAWCFWKNVSWDTTIRSSSGLRTFELIWFACFRLLIFHLYHFVNRYGEWFPHRMY